MVQQVLFVLIDGLTTMLFSDKLSDPTDRKDLPLRVEALEPRLMLSGNVSVQFFGGNLIIQGDQLNNDLSIEVEQNRILLVGNDQTTINGSQGAFEVSNTNTFDGSIFAFLRDGNDRFVIEGEMSISGSVFVYGGDGDDSIGTSQATVESQWVAVSGRGDDLIALDEATIQGSARFITGGGDDVISANETEVGQHVFAFLGQGDDQMLLETMSISGDVRVHSARGDDDFVMRESRVDGNLKASMAAGDDFFCIEPSTLNGKTAVITGRGNDEIILESTNRFEGPTLIIGGAGQDSFEVSDANTFNGRRIEVSVESNQLSDGTIAARLNADPGGVFANADVAQTMFTAENNGDGDGGGTSDPDPIGDFELLLDTSGNNVTIVNGIDVVSATDFVISGNTTPGATISFDRDNSGLFDLATTVADDSGEFTATVPLSNDGQANGTNQFTVRAVHSDNESVEQAVEIYSAAGPVVQMDTSLGLLSVELFVDDNGQPTETAANFLNYIRDDGLAGSRFDDSIIHRSSDFDVPSGLPIIQGGGFAFINDEVQPISRDPAIPNDFNASNVQGTIAMALTSTLTGTDVNSATSQWFINVGDNSASLDPQLFTVFGRILGDSQTTVDAIHALPRFDISAIDNNGLTEVPLRNYSEVETALTGTVDIAANSNQLIGTGTEFLTDLQAGTPVRIGANRFEVASVESDTAATLTQLSNDDQSQATLIIENLPGRNNYVVLSASELSL